MLFIAVATPPLTQNLSQSRLPSNAVWSQELCRALCDYQVRPCKVGTKNLQGVETLRRTLHGPVLSSNKSADQVVICIVYIDGVSSSLSYPYNLPGVENAPSSLEDVTTSDFYILDSPFMMESALLEDAPSPGSHFDVDAVDNAVRLTLMETNGIQLRKVRSICLMT